MSHISFYTDTLLAGFPSEGKNRPKDPPTSSPLSPSETSNARTDIPTRWEHIICCTRRRALLSSSGVKFFVLGKIIFFFYFIATVRVQFAGFLIGGVKRKSWISKYLALWDTWGSRAAQLMKILIAITILAATIKLRWSSWYSNF